MAAGITVKFRTSEEESADYKAMAAECGVSVSEWIRTTLKVEIDSSLAKPDGLVAYDAAVAAPVLPEVWSPDQAGDSVPIQPAVDEVVAVEQKLADLPQPAGGAMWSCPTCAKNGRPRRNYAKDDECQCGTKRPKGA